MGYLAGLSFLVGASLSLQAVAGSHSEKPGLHNPRGIFVEQVARNNFSVVLDTLRQQLKDDGWNLVAEVNLGARLQKKGVGIPGGLVILKFTGGKNAAPLLAKDDTRYFSAFIPCGVSVYGTSDGTVVISRMNHALMGSMMKPKFAAVMNKSSERTDRSISAAIAKLDKQ